MKYKNIKVDTRTMRNDASQVKQINEAVRNDIEKLFDEVMVLDSMWDGPANEEFNKQFQKDKKVFLKFLKAVDKYASCMEKAANDYDKCENEVCNYISNLRV